MSDVKPGFLAERLAQTEGLVVVCAPPGFGKFRLIEHASAIAGKAGFTLKTLTGADFVLDAMAAADAVLAANPSDIVTIRQVSCCDIGALEKSLNIRALAADSPRIWLAVDHPTEVGFARILAEGKADMIDSRSLRFDEVELKQSLGRIPARFRKPVGELAQGWEAAVTFLTRWAQAAHPDDASWDQLEMVEASGLAGFIEQEVAPLLNDTESKALIYASVVASIELGSADQGSPECRSGLVSACRKLAGLVNRSGDRIWIQPAFRCWLRGRFDALPVPQKMASLEMTAAGLVANGRLAEAARLLCQAGAANKIEQLVQDNGSMLIWMVHGYSTLEELVANAPDSVVERSEALQLMRCIVLMKSGRIGEAQAHFGTIDSKPATDPIIKRDREILRVTLLAYGCDLQRETDLEQFREIVAENTTEPGWRSLLSTLSCILNTQRARFSVAQACLVDARAHARSAKSQYNLMFLSLHEASLQLAKGELKLARAALSDARKRWRQEFPEDQGAETVLSGLSASLEYELGQITAARSSVRRSAYRMPDSEAWFDIYGAAYEPMIRIIAFDHGLGAALEALDDQRRKLENQGLPRVAALLQNMAHILAGEAWLRGEDQLQVPIPAIAAIGPTSTWQENEFHLLATAYLHVRVGNCAQADRVLKDGVLAAKRLGLMRTALRLGMARVGLLYKIDPGEEAQAELRTVLKLGAQLNAKQVFQHHMTPGMAESITEIARRLKTGRSSVARFASTLDSTHAAMHRDSSLSARESEVLAALSEGGSDKVLGRLLGLSEHGVRFHLKSIYRKLDVHDRASAIHRGRTIGAIVPTRSSSH